MDQHEKQSHEHVEAVPGPAIIISRETYKKMQESDNSKQNKERLKQCEDFFKNITMTIKSTDDERVQ